MDLTSPTLSTHCFFLFYVCRPLSVSLPFFHSHPTRTITLALSATLHCPVTYSQFRHQEQGKQKKRKKNYHEVFVMHRVLFVNVFIYIAYYLLLLFAIMEIVFS